MHRPRMPGLSAVGSDSGGRADTRIVHARRHPQLARDHINLRRAHSKPHMTRFEYGCVLRSEHKEKTGSRFTLACLFTLSRAQLSHDAACAKNLCTPGLYSDDVGCTDPWCDFPIAYEVCIPHGVAHSAPVGLPHGLLNKVCHWVLHGVPHQLPMGYTMG